MYKAVIAIVMKKIIIVKYRFVCVCVFFLFFCFFFLSMVIDRINFAR